MKKNLLIAGVAVAAVAVYLATKGAAPWWSTLELSPDQRAMLEDQERAFWPELQGNTGYPVEAMTNVSEPAPGGVWA